MHIPASNLHQQNGMSGQRTFFMINNLPKVNQMDLNLGLLDLQSDVLLWILGLFIHSFK